jgi:hypothetical protein
MVYPQLNSGALDNTRQQPKPNTEPNVAARTAPQTTSHLSQDNAADIKHDLIVLGAHLKQPNKSRKFFYGNMR